MSKFTQFFARLIEELAKTDPHYYRYISPEPVTPVTPATDMENDNENNEESNS
jgi:hypothetical protein